MIIAVLIPDPSKKKYAIEVRVAASVEEFVAASKGTVQAGRLVHEVDGEVFSTPIKTLRGDRKGPNGETITNIRPWEKVEFAPRLDDLFQERLYAIQWITKETLAKPRQTTFFTSVRQEDEERERKVHEIVKTNLPSWQADGLIPDMPIEAGEETSRLLRERGWTYWHHVFTPRDYIVIAALLKHNTEPEIGVLIPSLLNHTSKLCQWATTNAPLDADGNQAGGARDLPNHVFYNQAFNTFWNYASRATTFLLRDVVVSKEVPSVNIHGTGAVANVSALESNDRADVFITDPPYADAVHYHEISEFFIAWLRKRPSAPFKDWVWDSRRAIAIKGDGEDFRIGMVKAYRRMTDNMPDNGLQVVMFTHQSSAVWADMTQIFWGAGLQVMAAWYIATETTSELKKGGYVPCLSA
jgi:adenine-specific DNA methylase